MEKRKNPTKAKRRQPARGKTQVTTSHLVERDGIFVYTGPVREDLTDAVERDREERTRQIARAGVAAVLWGG